MPYLVIEDFKGGLDRRRMELASAPGSLQVLQNAHINRGGEIEKAKSWVSKYTLPAGTYGLVSLNDTLYVFGSGTDPGVPVGTSYQQLASPDGEAMAAVIATTNFSGGAFVTAEYTGSVQYKFYLGAVIDDWHEGLVRASMTNNDGIATHLGALINADTGNVVSASVVGSVVTITADATNVAFTISASAVNKTGGTNDQTAVVATPTPPSVGVAQVSTVTVGGTFEPGDKFTVIINGRFYGITGLEEQPVSDVITHKNKIYATAGVNLFFSGVAEPAKWKAQDTGYGVIDMSAQASNEEFLTAVAVYQNNIAAFTRNTTQIWSMDADPALNVQLQVLDNVGTRAPKSVVSFGDSDVFFLSDFGIRSLRARDSSNSAGITDVGTPIDELIIAEVDAQSGNTVIQATGAIEPRNGRYLLSINDKQYVFTYFPTAKIAAWSTWNPGFSFSEFASLSGRLYGRSGNVIYLLGGDNNETYTSEEVVVEMPYLDARSIATWERWIGIDLVLEGQWDVYVNANPLFPDEWELSATVFESSTGQLKLGLQQYAPAIKFKFVHQGTGPARISKVIVHYNTTVSS